MQLFFKYVRQGCALVLLFGLWLYASTASAQVRCLGGTQLGAGSSTSNSTVVPAIKFPASGFTPGGLIWRSEVISYQVTCTGKAPGNVYISVDPDKQLSGIHASLDVQIEIIEPISYTQSVKWGGNVNTGEKIFCTPFCEPGDSFAHLNRYPPFVVNIRYRVAIRTGSVAPPADGKFSAGTYNLFRLAGEKDTGVGNFGGMLSGLNMISIISCKPNITVGGSSGATVNFGAIPMAGAVAGKIAKQMPFSVNVDMSGPDNGQACPKSTMLATFSTTYPVQGGNTIMPVANSGFGIVLSTAATPATPIAMGTPVNLGLVNGTFVQNKFMAGVKWLNRTPAIGPFKASATVEVTFR